MRPPEQNQPPHGYHRKPSSHNTKRDNHALTLPGTQPACDAQYPLP